MEATIATPAPTVQHITKASSDQLLSKFAVLDSPEDRGSKKSLHLFTRQKRTAQSSSRRESSEFTHRISLAERKSLLPPVLSACRSSSAAALLRRAHFRSRNFRKRSFVGTIEKTWQRAVDEASKVFMGKQYNRHKRLLSETI